MQSVGYSRTISGGGSATFEITIPSNCLKYSLYYKSDQTPASACTLDATQNSTQVESLVNSSDTTAVIKQRTVSGDVEISVSLTAHATNSTVFTILLQYAISIPA